MARSKFETPASRTTGPKTQIAEPAHKLLLAAIALLWLALILVCFFSVELDKNSHFSRWDFWVFVPDLVDPPAPDASAGHSGWQYFPQRLDLLAVAAVILAGAWGAGHLVLRIIRFLPLVRQRRPWIAGKTSPESPLPHLAERDDSMTRSLERTVFAFGLGLAALSLVTLGAGLVGWLSRPFLAGILAVFVVAEIVLRVARCAATHGTTGGDQFASNRCPPAARQFLNPKSACPNPGGPILFESVPAPGSPGRNSKLTSTAFALLLVPAAPFLLAMLLGSLLPSTDFDVNEYHFEGPKEFFQAGRISFLEHNVYTSFPFGTEMLTLLAMVLSNDWYRGALAGKCVLMCFAPLTALALLAAGRRSFGRTEFGTLAGVCAAFLYLAMPWVFRISTIAYAEGSLCFYLFAALLALMIALEDAGEAHVMPWVTGAGPKGSPGGEPARLTSGEWKPFLLAGLLAGSAMACKYPALLSVVVPLGAAVVFSIVLEISPQYARGRGDSLPRWRFGLVLRSPSDGGPRWSCAAGFGLGVLIAVGPWLLKNLIETGNPVYPLAYRLFDGRDWDWALDARWRKAHSPSTYSVASLVDLALDVAFRSTWVSPLLVGLAPWALGARRFFRRTIWLWGYVAWLLLSCWLFTHRIDRFWVPLLPVLALLAGVGCAWWWSEFPRRWARAVMIIPLAAVSLFQLAFITDPHGLCGYNDFLRDLDEASAVAAYKTAPELLYLNEHLPEGAKVLSVGDAEMFEARFPVVYNTVFDRSIFEDWFAATPGEAGADGAGAGGGLRDPAAIRKKLADEGITHIYVNWLEILRYRAPGSYGYTDFVTPERFAELQKLGILGREWTIAEATMEVDRLDALWREELNRWGAGLKIRLGVKEAFTTFQVFPVAAERGLASIALVGVSGAESRPFRIQVVDDETGRGVPLVELTTVNNIRYFTDSNGIVAFDEPGLLDQSVFFHVQSHGYEFPKDGFGIRGQALPVKAGGAATLKIKRLNVAHRLYRVTGAGIYRDSELCGFDLPIRQPLINGKVLGSDSVINAIYHGQIYWFWGDTNRPGYPLGNFHVPGATSELPGNSGLDPRMGVDLTYFVDETGFAKPTAKMPGDGPTWINGLVVLPGDNHRERMFAPYIKVKPPLEVYEHGLAEFDDATSEFKKRKSFENDAPLYPDGHPFVEGAGDSRHVYFSHPYPLVRVRATPASLANLAEYDAFTCLKPGNRLNKPEIDRGPDGRIRYAWKPNTPAVGPAEQAKLIAAKLVRPEEALLQLADRDSGKPVIAHHGSVYWNEFLKSWAMITVEIGGSSSHLGEVWYAEADSPVGPWAYAVKIVTHDRYSFYNPKQHPMFDQNGGRSIFFEGTYTHTFSGNNDQTPRYDYNQIMYRLDLDDSRAVVPVAFYSQADPDRFAARPLPLNAPDALNLPELSGIAFFACEQPASGSIALCESKTTQGQRSLATKAKPDGDDKIVCYVLPADAAKPPATCVGLYEYAADDGRRVYSTDAELALGRFKRQAQPICRVWRNPWKG
jgi:hypothetical protein